MATSIRDIYHLFDQTLQDKFEGKLGKMATREAFVIAFLLVTHKAAKIPLTPQQEKELDKLWYGSILPNHPLHPVRGWVREKVGDFGEGIDNLTGRHLQHKFEWFDRQVPHVRAHLQRKADGY